MNALDRPFIDIVVPDLFGRPGGIARICRSLCLATAHYCAQAGIQLSVLALNDPGTTRDARYLPDGVEYLGFSGDRAALALEVIRRGHCANHRLTIFGHVNLATPALLFPVRREERTRRYAVLAHGIEVWTRLPSHRRAALSHAREIWSVSAYTARQIEDLQDVSGRDPPRRPQRARSALRDSRSTCRTGATRSIATLHLERVPTEPRRGVQGVDTRSSAVAAHLRTRRQTST